MTNEIKEILDDWQKFLSWSYENNDKTIEIYRDNVKKILDYITNLQEEKKEMKDGWQQEIYDKNKVLSDWLEDERKINILQQRIDKAVEYIDKIFYVKSGLSPKQATDLLNILRGDE